MKGKGDEGEGERRRTGDEKEGEKRRKEDEKEGEKRRKEDEKEGESVVNSERRKVGKRQLCMFFSVQSLFVCFTCMTCICILLTYIH